VFEPSHNDSPLGQHMDEPWAYVPSSYFRAAPKMVQLIHAILHQALENAVKWNLVPPRAEAVHWSSSSRYTES
jgi:hypothetical protein